MRNPAARSQKKSTEYKDFVQVLNKYYSPIGESSDRILMKKIK